MRSIVAGQPLMDLIRLCYEADCPVLLEGRHGLGKSEILEQAANHMGIGFISRDLSLMEPPDLMGLPYRTDEGTKYAPPAFLPRDGKGILVFEELNRCEKHMRSPCLQLLTSRCLNDYQLPQGWLPMAAINPYEDGYDVDELDAALLSRFSRIPISADRREWLRWAEQNGIHPAVSDYVRSDKTAFDDPHSSPRSWRYVSDVLKAADQQPTPPHALQAAVIGLVGETRGAAFLGSLEGCDVPVSAEQILAAYGQHREQVCSWIEDGRLDLVQGTLRNVLIYVQPEADYEAIAEDKATWRNLGQFLHDLPGDLREQAKGSFEDRGYDYPKRPRRRRMTIA